MAVRLVALLCIVLLAAIPTAARGDAVFARSCHGVPITSAPQLENRACVSARLTSNPLSGVVCIFGVVITTVAAGTCRQVPSTTVPPWVPELSCSHAVDQPINSPLTEGSLVACLP